MILLLTLKKILKFLKFSERKEKALTIFRVPVIFKKLEKFDAFCLYRSPKAPKINFNDPNVNHVEKKFLAQKEASAISFYAERFEIFY